MRGNSLGRLDAEWVLTVAGVGLLVRIEMGVGGEAYRINENKERIASYIFLDLKAIWNIAPKTGSTDAPSSLGILP